MRGFGQWLCAHKWYWRKTRQNSLDSPALSIPHLLKVARLCLAWRMPRRRTTSYYRHCYQQIPSLLYPDLDFDDNQSVDGGRLVCIRSAIDRVVSGCFEGVFFATTIKTGVSITVICNGKKAPISASPFACDINPPIYIRKLDLDDNKSLNGGRLHSLSTCQSPHCHHIDADSATAIETAAVARTVPSTVAGSAIPREASVIRCSNKITTVVRVVVAPTVIMVTYIRALNSAQNPSQNHLSRNVPGTTVKIIKICCIILLLNKFQRRNSPQQTQP